MQRCFQIYKMRGMKEKLKEKLQKKLQEMKMVQTQTLMRLWLLLGQKVALNKVNPLAVWGFRPLSPALSPMGRGGFESGDFKFAFRAKGG